MSRYIATAAIRGANQIVAEAEALLQQALAEKGAATPVAFPNTAYFLPVIFGLIGHQVETLADLKPVVERSKSLLHPIPAERRWTPYLGETLDCGIATLLAEETIQAIRFAFGQQPEPFEGFHLAQAGATAPEDGAGGIGGGRLNGPIDDIQLRAWGIQLVDGRMPGFAAIVGCARSNEVAVKIVRELQRRNILTFLSGNVNGRSIIHQLQEEGVEMGYDTYIVPFGTDTISAIYALGFATRSALTFGGLKGGQAREILLYNKARVFAFVLALGEVDDLKYATAAGAINYGFPVIADTLIPQILPTGVTTYEHVVSMPFGEIPGQDDLERAERLVQKCIEVRGVKIRMTEVPIPVPYGSAFEGEVVRKADLRVEFGGKHSRAFEYLYMADFDAVQDGLIEVVGPGWGGKDGIEPVPMAGAMDLGIVVKVAGRKMQEDFEPVLERQIHHFLNGASGMQHIGQRDITWIRLSKTAADKGFTLRHIGDILHARLHADFGAIVDKVQVTIYTRPDDIEHWLEVARRAYDYRNRRLAGMSDEDVTEFYSCTLCAPAGEQIVLADGSFVPIEKLIDTVVEERDLNVLTFEDTTLSFRPVGELFINPAPSNLVRLRLSDGNTVTLTANHKIWVDKPQGLDWVPADKIRAGDYLASATKLPAGNSDDSKPIYLIDLVPDAIRVYDRAFLAQLKHWLVARYGTLAVAAESLGFKRQRLYHGLSYNLTITEVKRLLAGVDQAWEGLKGTIREIGYDRPCRLEKGVLDESLMYAAGLVASDGSITWPEGNSLPRDLVFVNTEPALIGQFNQVMVEHFGQTFSVIKKPRTEGRYRKTLVARAYPPVVASILVSLGVRRPSDGRKWDGEFISQLPSNLVAAFLAGLLDGDGHVNDNGIGITTGDYATAHQTNLLLRKLGLSLAIRKATGCYQVCTRNQYQVEQLQTLIPFRHPAKRSRAEALTFPADVYHVVRTDTVPSECGQLIKNLVSRYELPLSGLTGVDRGTIYRWINGRHRISKMKLGTFLAEIVSQVDTSDPEFQHLLDWSKSVLTFERVTAIETVPYTGEKVYNFSVEGTHNYLLNGVVVKNCQSFAPNHVCIVSPERLGLCGAYSYLDCKASFQINPTGPNQPVSKGILLDSEKGYWAGPNAFVHQKSNQSVEQVSMYSIMENPMTACLPGDAQILADGQVMAIGEFVSAHSGEPFHTSQVWTLRDGVSAADALASLHRNRAPSQLIRLTTRSGLRLTLTPNHKIATDRPDGRRWVRADDIQPGERVYALKRLPMQSFLPAMIDLLPDSFRVAEPEWFAGLLATLRARHGSLSAGYRAADVRPIHPRMKSVTLANCKRLVKAADQDWEQVKRQVKRVVAGPSQFDLPDLSPDLLYLLGLLASDGALSRRGKHECFVNFVNTDGRLLGVFEDTYRRVFPRLHLGFTRKKDSISTIDGREIRSARPSYAYYAANALLGALADGLGVKMAEPGRRWDLRRLLRLPEGHIAAFIAGVFDGDGSVRLRQADANAQRWPAAEAYFPLDEARAAEDAQLLLKRLGIVSSVRSDKRLFRIEIRGANLRRFAEVIPVRHPSKAEALRRILSLPKADVDKTASEVLPYAVGKAIADEPLSATILSPSTLFYYKTARSRPVLENALKVVEELPADHVLRTMLDTDAFLDTVESVESISNDGQFDEVYNLTLCDIHSYWANQILVANCGCFECIVMVVPEANGVMVVSREDTSMTPAGMTFSTLAGICGGGIQTPGVMGIGKYYLTSKKFLSADGGFMRVVWMSSILKETMAEELREAAAYADDPDLIEKIADERVATSVDDLLAWLEDKNHPAMIMPPLF